MCGACGDSQAIRNGRARQGKGLRTALPMPLGPTCLTPNATGPGLPHPALSAVRGRTGRPAQCQSSLMMPRICNRLMKMLKMLR